MLLTPSMELPNMNLKNIIAALAVSAALIAGVTYARADECHIAPLTETIAHLTEGGAVATPVSDGEVAKLVDAKGLPPGAEGKPFTVIRVDMNDFSALLVVQGDCINDKVGPIPSQLIDNVLGSVKASG